MLALETRAPDAGVRAAVPDTSRAPAPGLVSRDVRPAGAAQKPATWRAALRSAAPLAALGLGRLASTRLSGYEVPVDEYGRDWNFFFTLAAVRLLAAAPSPVRRALRAPGGGAAAAAAATCCVLLLHETLLQRGGGAAWLSSDTRAADVFSQNREGLCSVVRDAAGPHAVFFPN